MVHGQNNGQDNIIIGILSFILVCLGIVYYWLGIVKTLNIIIGLFLIVGIIVSTLIIFGILSLRELAKQGNDFLLKIKRVPNVNKVFFSIIIIAVAGIVMFYSYKPPESQFLYALTAEDEIQPLMPPIKDIALPQDDSASSLKVQRILEGQAPDSASRVFDITLVNPSNDQVMLTYFDIRWRYDKGWFAAIDQGVVLKPISKYVIGLPIDTDDPEEKQKLDTIYPIIIVPPRTESGSSITTFRIQFHYYFSGRIDWHPSSDWNIIFSLGVRDDKGGTLRLFSNSLWR